MTRGNDFYARLLLEVTIAPEEIGRRIKAARHRRGWTQLQFAAAANVSPSSVQRWEAGKLPPVRELMRLADVLEIATEELVEVEPVSQDGAVLELLVEVREEQRRADALLRELAAELRQDRASDGS